MGLPTVNFKGQEVQVRTRIRHFFEPSEPTDYPNLSAYLKEGDRYDKMVAFTARNFRRPHALYDRGMEKIGDATLVLNLDMRGVYPKAITEAIVTFNQGQISYEFVGYAWCSKKDQYVRKLGNRIALGRAFKKLERFAANIQTEPQDTALGDHTNEVQVSSTASS